MGITGLLKGLSPLLIPENEIKNPNKGASRANKPSTPKNNIRQFKNKVLAVDASSWLYKASYSTSERLVEAIEADKIDPVCEKILSRYMIKRCEELLITAEIKRIFLVFDGKRCPLKAATNLEREEKRRRNLAEARELSQNGLKDQASDKYKACIKVVPWMANSVGNAVAQRWKTQSGFTNAQPTVTCIWSPYEADAQLVKLCIDGLADAVVTEDSDVLVYSAASNFSFPIIYKLDRDQGFCDVISMDWLLRPSVPFSSSLSADIETRMGLPSIRRVLSPQPSSSQVGKKTARKQGRAAGGALLSHLQAMVSRESRSTGCGARMFVQACVLAGCDYAPSQLSGVGLVTAFKIIKENAHREPHCRFLHALKSIPKDKLLTANDVTDYNVDTLARKDAMSLIYDYEELLAKSECVFYRHRVLDTSGKVVPLVGENFKDIITEDYIPSMTRFDNELFIGNLNVHRNADVKPPRTTSNFQNKKPARPTNTCIPPNTSSSKDTNSKKPKTNIFSYYRHEVTPLLSKKARCLPPSTRQVNQRPSFQQLSGRDNILPGSESSSEDEIDEILKPIAISKVSQNADRAPLTQPTLSKKLKDNTNKKECSQQQNAILSLSSDSSDDEIDDVLRPMLRTKPFNNEELSQHHSSYSGMLLKSSVKHKPIRGILAQSRSKYFFSQQGGVDESISTEKAYYHISNLKRANNLLEQKVRVALVTPTSSETNAKINSALPYLDDSSEEETAVPIPIITGKSNSKLVRELPCDNCDDDDCIIVEVDELLKKRTPIITPFASSQSSCTATQSSTFGSTFAKAQREGTRGKIASLRIKKKRKKLYSDEKALGKPKKKMKNASIKGFFLPLKSRDSF